jgi:hypothetical protein
MKAFNMDGAGCSGSKISALMLDQPLHPIPRRCPLGNLVVELILLLVGGCGLAAGNP